MKIVKSIIFFAFISGLTYGQQIREFSTDTAEFKTQFIEFMSDLEEEQEFMLYRFINAWNYDSINYEQKLQIMEASNHMLRRRARPEPHFTQYVRILLKQLDPELQSVNLPKWFESYNYLLSTSDISFNELNRGVNLALGLIEDSLLYDLAGTTWSVNTNTFVFDHNNFIPVVRFKDVDLTCIANRDTLKVFSAEGSYNLINLLWSGVKGKVTWERAGFSPENVYAELKNYRIELNRSQFRADSVKFYYKKYFDFPLEGYLLERAMPISKPSNATFPKFYSYQSFYDIPELFNEIEFTGGLSMQGAKLVGTGTLENPAELFIRYDDTLRMVIRSRNIVIRESGMTSTSVELTMPLESDSIYHPDLDFLYLEETDELRLTKRDVYTSGVPYSNTYHNVNMNFEELSWKRGSNLIRMSPSIGRAIGTATFESNEFFNYQVFSELQGRDYAHPLVSLWNFSRSVNGAREFPLRAYSGNIGMPDYQVRHQMMKLSRLGFIFYDDQKDMITLKDKLFYFVEASVGRTDYDVIFFESNVDAPTENATLNLQNFDLSINGIPNIFLSDSQNVILFPSDKKIVMKRNKNFQFNGTVRAGLFTLFGNNFFFSYDSFKINLQEVDSLRVQVMTEDRNTGQKEIFNIENLIQNLTGEILIDDPENKSGLENYPKYPVFKSTENSYVYFDDSDIQGGVYDRGEVYFELEPFEIDSLDNFDRQGMELTGVFESSGLLPPLTQTLTLRDDNSLGFVYSTPDIGLPVYDGKGTFYNDLEMSSAGLHGAGQLDYLTSTTYSDDFIFHPDSMMTNSREFLIRKQLEETQFPKGDSRNNPVKWYTQKEEFHVDMADIPFTLFSDTVRLEGDLVLKPSGLSGSGKMDMVTASVISKEFNYRAERFFADTADFRLNSPLSEKLAINTSNVRANVNFDNRNGQFFANEDYTLVEFPDILYSSNLDFFEWDMISETVRMGQKKEVVAGEGEDGLSGPRYYSLLPSQDSLNFVSPLAIYDYQEGKLNATEVPYIQVADARIFPGDGNIRVGKNAAMEQLVDATIITDYRNENFRLYNAGVSVLGKYRYTASADYDYVDITGDPQVIHFNSIRVDTSIQTVAEGEIIPDDNFQLSPYFLYHGEVYLTSRDPHLRFKGGTRIVHDCELGRHWLKFEAVIDPENVMIPVSESPTQMDLNPTYAGTMISRDSTHVYSTFFSMRKDYFDRFISTASGWLRFDSDDQKYEISSLDKLENPQLTGNYLSLDRNSCQVHGQGELSLQTDFGQVKMRTVGEANHNLPRDNFSTRLMMALDFHFSSEALTLMANDLDSIPGIEPMDIRDSFYQQSLRELVGKDAADRMQADLGLFAEYRNIPPELEKTIVLSDVNLEWNQYSRSYRYEGEIGIVRIGDRMINRKVNVIMEITKRASGDLMDIYFVLDDDTWYYFGYNPGSMQVVSSNRVYNNLIFELKARERKLRVRLGNTGYIYSLAPERRVQLFLRRFNAASEQGL